jgi:hypothetical protein
MEFHGVPYRRLLEQVAVEGKPRLFTVFGTTNDYEREPMIGWGMELQNRGGVLFRYLGRSAIHSADTPERLLRTQRILGDVELRWLDN